MVQICMQIIKKVIVIQQLRSLGELLMKNDDAKNIFLTLIERNTFYKRSIQCNENLFLNKMKKKLSPFFCFQDTKTGGKYLIYNQPLLQN